MLVSESISFLSYDLGRWTHEFTDLRPFDFDLFLTFFFHLIATAGKFDLFRDDPDGKNGYHAACIGTLRAGERLFGYKCTKPAICFNLREAPTPLLHLAVLDIVLKLKNKSYAKPKNGLEIMEAIVRLVASRQPMPAAPVPIQSRAEVEKELSKLYKKLKKEDFNEAPEKQGTEAAT